MNITLYNLIRNLLETRVIIKIEFHQFYPINHHGDEAKKNKKMAD